MTVARYGQAFKDRAVARLLPPESAALEVVAREVGIGAGTLERWREDAQSRPARGRAWTAGARLEAVITGGNERGGQERLVPRTRRISGRARQVAWQLHQRAGRSRGRSGQPAGHAGRPQAHQGTRARLAAQGSGAGRDGGPVGAVKKTRGDLPQGRGRMIGLEDRQTVAQNILMAHAAGARLRLACETAGIELRTLQRWKAHGGLTAGDGRPHAVRPMPSHALSPAERAQLLAVANEPRFAAVPPARIVPMLADEGVYLASESSFSRVLREHGQNVHRGRAKAPKASRPPSTHIATAAREVWCWDMSYLPAVVMGRWFHLYLILDLYSRKIVGWEVHDTDDSEHGSEEHTSELQ